MNGKKVLWNGNKLFDMTFSKRRALSVVVNLSSNSSSINSNKNKGIRLRFYTFGLKRCRVFNVKLSNFHYVPQKRFLFFGQLGHSVKSLSTILNSQFLGVRYHDCFINPEKSLELLTYTGFICQTFARVGLTALFINLVTEFNGITKVAAGFCCQALLLDDFKGGFFTNRLIKIPGIVFVSNSKKHSFILKEASLLHLPIISLHDSNDTTNLSTLSIFSSDDSIEVQYVVLQKLTSAFIKGSFLYFLDKSNFVRKN